MIPVSAQLKLFNNNKGASIKKLTYFLELLEIYYIQEEVGWRQIQPCHTINGAYRVNNNNTRKTK